MKQKGSIKLNILKKILGKRVAVITNYSSLEHYYGEVTQVIDESMVLVKNDINEEYKVSIFDIRNPAQEL